MATIALMSGVSPGIVGAAANKTAGATSIALNPTQAVAIGTCIIVGVAMDPSAGSVTCADSKGNTYTLKEDVANGSGTSGVRTLTFVSYNIASALATTDTITVSHPSAAARAVVAGGLTNVGLTDASGFDTGGTGTGSGSSGGATTSGSVASTGEAAIVVVGFESNSGSAVNSPMTDITNVASSGGGSASNVAVCMGYQFNITSGSTYTGSGSIASGTPSYAANIIALKPKADLKLMKVVTVAL